MENNNNELVEITPETAELANKNKKLNIMRDRAKESEAGRKFNEKINGLVSSPDDDLKNINEKFKVDDPYKKAKILIENYLRLHPDEAQKAQPIKSQLLASTLVRCFNFIRVSEDEGTRVAIYVDDRTSSRYGLYTQNYDYLSRVIFKVLPSFDTKLLKETILKINLDSSIRKVGRDELRKYGRKYKPVENGLYNRETKELDAFTSDVVFTAKAGTRFVKNAPEPTYKGLTVSQLLKSLSSDEHGREDKDMYTLLWQVIADAIDGNSRRNKAIALYSQQGNSGKGTFQELIISLVGFQNVASLLVKEFQERFAINQAIGKLVITGDDNPNKPLKETNVFQSVVTGDPVRVERKGKDAYMALISATVIQSFNELPKTANKDGFLRRWKIVPFRRHFTDEGKGNDIKEDKNIKDDFLSRKDVLEYILFTALDKYSDFDTFIKPAACVELEEQYAKYNDSVKEFIDDEFIPRDVSAIPNQAIYGWYRNFCTNAGMTPFQSSKFIDKATHMLKTRNDGKEYTYKPKKTTSAMITECEELKVDGASINKEYYGKPRKTYYAFVKN